MYFLNISLLLAASLVSTVHARHPVGAHHHHRRQYDNGTYPATSTAVVSPIPVSSVPMGTGVSSVEDAVTTKVTNATLTYTMGQGTSTTVVTTTILRTETLTRIQTVYATREPIDAVESDAVESDIDFNSVAVTTAGGSEAEPTTTITSRSTTTRTITVESIDPSDGDYGSPATSVAGGGAPATGSACGAVVTVTATIKSTVTVTAGAATAPVPGASTTNDAGSLSSSIKPNVVLSSSSTKPAITPGQSNFVPILLASGSSAPYNNGTSPSPTKSKKKCASSGFLTKAKPTTLPSAYKRS